MTGVIIDLLIVNHCRVLKYNNVQIYTHADSRKEYTDVPKLSSILFIRQFGDQFEIDASTSKLIS